MTHSTLGRGVLALFVLPLVLLAACGKDDEITVPTVDDDQRVLVENFGTPDVAFDPDDGTTTVVVQFVARDGVRDPLRDENLDIELRIDGQPIDVEGLLSVDSAALASSLHLTLVLDASYSMLRQSPPAFTPMLTSAVRSTQSGKSLYVERPGTFTWDLYWFNNLIYRPDTTLGSPWLENDIQRIPAPQQGTYTKLYAAVKAAVESSAAHRASTNATARDQHLVVVFSDGADNYSFHDNANESGTGSIDSDRAFSWNGAAPVTLNDVKTLLDANPGVQVHAMGLGSDVSDQALASIASNGRGRYFKNVDAGEVDVLFDEVTKEFTSLQTRGATVPLPPGDYVFSVVVRRTDTGAVANYDFRFRGGVVDARVLN